MKHPWLRFVLLIALFTIWKPSYTTASSEPAAGDVSTTTLEVLKLFHGHLGPYVVIGAKMGDFAVHRLTLKKHFDVRVVAECETKPPVSCLVDGLQASTGATYGKQNIFLLKSPDIRVKIINTKTLKAISFHLSKRAQEMLNQWAKEKLNLEKQTDLVSHMTPEELFVIDEYDDRSVNSL